jgi:hypothetical protein
LLHLGSLPGTRNPENLWQVISELVETNIEFSSRLKVRLIGKADLKVSESIRKFKLQQYVTLEEYVPHEQTLSLLGKASLLLLCINNSPNARGILTNKFFEYLSARRPIIALGPLDGDAAAILAETKAGRIFPYTDTTGLKEHVLALFDLYSRQKLYVESENYSRFSRKNLTRELCELLNNLTA